MKIKNIAVVALLSSSMMVGASNAQLKITGYTEAEYSVGSSRNIAPGFRAANSLWDAPTATTSVPSTPRLGNETSVRFETTHSLTGGLTATAMGELRNAAMLEREVRIGAADGSWVAFAGADVPRGIEISRTINPTVNNRVTDIVGSVTGLIDVIDSTSGNTYAGFEFPKAGPGRLSFAFMPNSDDATTTSTDGGPTASTNQGESRYSVGYAGTVGATTFGAGYLKGNNRIPTGKDSEAFTVGARHAFGPISIGIQYQDQDFATAAAASKSNQEQWTVSGTYALTKEFSIGYARTEAEQTNAGVKQLGEVQQDLFQAAYNFGPAVAQFDYVKVDEAQYVKNREINAVKAKVKVNF
jgi:predicted porin